MKITENPLVMLIEECIRLRDSAQDVLSPSLGGQSLTRIEGLVLVAVSEMNYPLTAPQVGRILGYTRQVVKRAVDRLVDLGFLERVENPDHKTAMLLKITDQGSKYKEKIGSIMVDVVDTLLSDADIELCRKMAGDLKRIRTLVEGYKPTPR